MRRRGWPRWLCGASCVPGVVPGTCCSAGESFVGAALVESHSAILRRLAPAGSSLDVPAEHARGLIVMGWVLGVLALGVVLVALYRFLPRVQERLVRPPRASPPAGPDRVGAAPEATADDPFFAEVDRFMRASARERQGPPPEAVRDAFSELVVLVRDHAVATRLVVLHGSAEDAVEAVLRDRRAG
jgi:hypothetical protein